MRTNLICSAIVLALAVGCSEKSGFDTLPPGSVVTVTERDGTEVTGRLVEVSSDEVVVDRQDEGRRVMRRDAVASISLTDEAVTAGDSSTNDAAEGEQWTEVTIPAGAVFDAKLETPVGSDVSAVEGPVTARVASDVVIEGHTGVPAGSFLNGTVVRVARPGKVKGRASVAFRFDRLVVGDASYDLRTETLTRRARSTTKEDAMKIGIPAVGGAIVGGIIGGGKGAAIGGATGAGAGTAVVMSTRGDNVHLPSGTPVKVQLVEPIRVRVRT